MFPPPYISYCEDITLLQLNNTKDVSWPLHVSLQHHVSRVSVSVRIRITLNTVKVPHNNYLDSLIRH